MPFIYVPLLALGVLAVALLAAPVRGSAVPRAEYLGRRVDALLVAGFVVACWVFACALLSLVP